jgi:gamma-glutamyltranspeptidase
MLIHLTGMPEPQAIEFMTRVPEAATLDNPALADVPREGPRVANVPGTVAGMGLAWRRFGSGRVSWAQIVAPAIRLAEEGFAIDEAFATTLRRERESFGKYESSRKLFFRDGMPLAAGDTLRNPDLAWTLREIAKGGAEAFYEGEPARRLVDDLHGQGNAMTLRDMKRYFAAERRPVTGTYRGHTIYSGPPPVTGGAGLIAKLNLLEQARRGGSTVDDAAEIHAMIEAWKLQPSTANRIADPDLWPIDITPFESKDTARMRWRCFDPDRASRPAGGRAGGGQRPPSEDEPCARGTASQNVPDAPLDAPAEQDASHSADEPCDPEARGRCRSTGTTAFAVADADGNMVSVAQTLGTWGGNVYGTPGVGFLYNDKFHSYRTDPDAYGARLPYARNSTVIAPTLVFRGTGAAKRPLLAAGAAGNAWITSAVYEIVVGVIDHGLGAQAALELPRFLPGGRGPGGETTIQIESGFAPAALRRLEAMGHVFLPISLLGELRMGDGAAVLVGDGKVEAGADPRRSGAAGAVR